MFNQKGFNEALFNAPGTTPSPVLTSEQYIEVRTPTGQTVALLSPESDGIKECWIDITSNGKCTISFEMPLKSEKWEYLVNPNRILAGGREFIILSPDAIEKSRDGQKLIGKVMAHESWTRLGRKYITVSNDPQTPNPPWSVVKILSGGAAHGVHAPGSAANALAYLLWGTGWTVGTVDVEGTHDLETEKESVLTNIQRVQEKWGGILVWDSVKKQVSLRDETTWQPYTGYQIRYAKNLKSITRTDDCDVITRVYPFGADDLDISSVNDGVLYLENFQHTTEELEGIYVNQEIGTPQELKDRAIRELAILSRPRHNYKVGMVDLRTLEGYRHETFEIHHMVDVVDEEMDDTDVRRRIIRHRYNVFQPWRCELEVGDPIETTAAMLANTIVASKYVKSSVRPNTSMQNLLKAMLDTAATEINGASGDYVLMDGVSTWRERVNGTLTGKMVRITPAGLVISHDGGQTWDLAINGAGINADVVNTGRLNAGVVQIGAASTFDPGYNPSEKFAQPGYVLSTNEGIKVFDAGDNLRVLLGSWLKDAIRKYGLKVIDGEIYASLIRTGAEGATSYIALMPDGEFVVVRNGHTVLETMSNIVGDGNIFFHDANGTVRGKISAYNDAYKGIGLESFADGVILRGGAITLMPSHVATIQGDLQVVGDIIATGMVTAGGAKPAQQVTQNYGLRYLYATEATELVYCDRGVIDLVNGEATVYLDPIYLECIEPDTETTPWQIWVECYGENGVYISEVGEDYFRVKERNGGTSHNKVVWKHEAIRCGYAEIRLMEVTD